MGYRQVMGESSYRSWKEWAIGDSVEGVLQKISEDQFGKPNYALKVVECKFEDSDAEIEVGKTLTLNSNGALDYAVNQGINIGDTFKVIYMGEDVMAKGKYKGKKFHKLQVLVKEGEVATAGAEDDGSSLLG